MSQIGTSHVPGHFDGMRREGRDSTPRDRVNKLLHDPKGYFADARAWAGGKAKADVQRELKEKQDRRESVGKSARRGRRSPILRALGFAR